jgi:hypothetical protein
MNSASPLNSVSATSQSVADAGSSIPLREIVSDAIRYWEPRRIVYNAVLAAIVLYHYYAVHQLIHTYILPPDFYLAVVIMALLANMCYCAAYIVDVFVQLSNFRDTWRSRRWMLFILGLVIAVILTQLIAEGMFSDPSAFVGIF